MARIWLDATGIRQANMLSVLAKSLSERAEILATTSADPRPARVFRFLHMSTNRVVGKGRDPLQRYARRILRLSREIEHYKPDLLISDLDSAAVRTAFGLGIPTWTIYTSEPGPNGLDAKRMSYPLCEKIFASSLIPKEKLVQEGIPRDRLVHFNGLNECYIRSIERKSGSRPRVLVRPNGHDSARWVRNVAAKILREVEDSQLTVLGKLPARGVARATRSGKVRFLEFIPHPPVLNQDLFIGYGRMLAESFVVGIPTIRTTNDNYPDLSMVYSQQPLITDPDEISEASVSMLRERRAPRPVSGLESPIAAVTKALLKRGLIS